MPCVIGGTRIFESALPLTTHLYITEVIRMFISYVTITLLQRSMMVMYSSLPSMSKNGSSYHATSEGHWCTAYWPASPSTGEIVIV